MPVSNVHAYDGSSRPQIEQQPFRQFADFLARRIAIRGNDHEHGNHFSSHSNNAAAQDFNAFAGRQIQQEPDNPSTAIDFRRNRGSRQVEDNRSSLQRPSANRVQGPSPDSAGTYSVSHFDSLTIEAHFTTILATNSATTQPTSPAPQPAASAQPPNVLGSSSNIASAAPSSSVATANQDPLQALNDALRTLGLSQQEIESLDQVANLIKSFNPDAFSDLVNQFQYLARQLTQGTSAPAASKDASSTGAAPVGENLPAAPVTAPSSGGVGSYQVQELTVHFSSVDVESGGGTGHGRGSGHGANNAYGRASFQASAFDLKIEQVNVLLSSGNGQTVQIQAPRQSPPLAETGVSSQAAA